MHFRTGSLLLALLSNVLVAVAVPTILHVREESTALANASISVKDTLLVPPSLTFTGIPSSAVCGGQRTFSSETIHDAIEKSAQLQITGQQIGTNKYPHVFRNKNQQGQPEITDFSTVCNGKTLYMFPILTNQLYDGGSPGPDRVVNSVVLPQKASQPHQVIYCGLITLDGASVRNDFVSCK